MRAILVSGALCALLGACGGEEEAPGGAAPSAAPVAGGCKNDNECKGERVCVKGECVDPAAAGPAAPAAPAPGAPAAPAPAAPAAPAAPVAVNGDPCAALPGEYCKACGDTSPACTGWTKYFADAQIFAGYPKEACKGMIDNMAIVMQTQKEATCAKDPSIHLPGGGAATAPPAAPAAPPGPAAPPVAPPAPAAGGAPCAVAGDPTGIRKEYRASFIKELGRRAPQIKACGEANGNPTGTLVFDVGEQYNFQMQDYAKVKSNDTGNTKVADCLKKELKRVAGKAEGKGVEDIDGYSAKVTIVCGAPP